MDTGSTKILMPKQDWLDLYDMVCANLPEGSTCYQSDYFYIITGYWANKDKFGPISVTIDNVIYQIPFERFFQTQATDKIVLRMYTKEMIVFGIQFLNSFY